MENIKKMEMASALFKKDCIKVEKAFFGLVTKITYIPTGSPVVGLSLEFDPINGEKVSQLIDASAGNLEALIKKVGCLKCCDNGNYRLSLCFSRDHRFAALQLHQFSNFSYRSVGEIRFVEGDVAEREISLFVK